MTRKFINELKVGDQVNEVFIVKSKRNCLTKNQKPYLDLDLVDRSGHLNAKVWDRAEELSTLFQRGDIIRVRGRVEEFKGARQFKITDLRPGYGDEVKMEDLLRRSSRDPDLLAADLEQAAKELKDEKLSALISAFFSDAEFMASFKQSAAARNLHHSYQGGLIEHTLNLVKAARFVCDELYAGEVDRDLVIAGAILHDIGKVRELDSKLEVGYTTEGYLLGHLALGSSLLREKAAQVPDFPAELLMALDHIILSHHGEKEWGSPVTPMTPEAMIVHLLDNLDAKTRIILSAIHDDQNPEEEFTSYHRTLMRHFYKGGRDKPEGEG